MEKKYKVYARLNLLSLFFVAVSFISITLAWFAYSGISNVSTEIAVKAWNINFDGGTKNESNRIVISSSEIYPGMETITEKIRIENLGDSDAQISYSIVEARILNDVFSGNDMGIGVLEDKLANDYPFHINISLTKNYAAAVDGVSELEVSLSWPLDSGHDAFDSSWGSLAYQFQLDEEKKQSADKTYQKQSALKIIINVKAEQKLDETKLLDAGYNLGDVVFFDVDNNKICAGMSDTCLKTYLINVDNESENEKIVLLPDLYSTNPQGTYYDYSSKIAEMATTWNVTTRPLVVEDLLKIISKDVINSFMIRDNLSDALIGNVDYGNRATTIVNNVISYNGYFKFLNSRFPYLSTTKCYWINTEYNNDNAFILQKNDDNYSQIHSSSKDTSCSIVPVIIVDSLSKPTSN